MSLTSDRRRSSTISIDAGRGRLAKRSLGPTLSSTITDARVLLVGAGGIGCELLKNLVLMGYREVVIVDLDTIDLSNLNRQFLFRHEHIKKPKALVAKEVAQRFNPHVLLQAHHANIKDSQFDIDWFKTFALVFNALDNLEARRHVNKMCIAADVPLIESGTTGFNGQVQVIKKGITACYDCNPKEVPKSYPVCTIRSTPSQPIHCIVWGKSYLLTEVFGTSESEEGSSMDHSQNSENAQELEKLKQEAQALKKIRESMGTEAFPQLLFDKVFKDDVNRLRSMEEMWKTRRAPDPLDYAVVLKRAGKACSLTQILQSAQKPWTLEENLIVFCDSLDRLSKRMKSMVESTDASEPAPVITFDKDDDDTLDFVTASANIRSIIFGIETKSKFDIKQMAGNIIPAIATTNAIVAGLCVLQSFKVLRGELKNTKEVFLAPFAHERLLTGNVMPQPTLDCPVCSVTYARLAVDLSRATLNDLVEDFLRTQLQYGEEFVVSSDVGTLYDVEETGNLGKQLRELGVKHDSFLTVTDDDEENPRVNLVLSIREYTSTEGSPIGALDIKRRESGEAIMFDIPRRPKQVSSSDQDLSEDIATLVSTDDKRRKSDVAVAALLNPKKRAAEDMSTDVSQNAKKLNLGNTDDSEPIVLDDNKDANAAIVIDDEE